MKIAFYAACCLFTILFLALDVKTPLGIADGPLYVGIIFLSLWTEDNKFTVRAAVVCSILTIIGYFLDDVGEKTKWISLLDRILSIGLISISAYLVLKKRTTEPKVLQGYIPICSTCKKIRDEDGEWHRLEDYLSEHSEATFTHCICDECFEKEFPETLRE